MYGKVGAQTLANGSTGPLRLDTDGALIARPCAGKYTEAAMAGRLFSVANQAAVATTAALATTWTGLGIANPSTSGKNVILYEFGYALTVVGPAATSVGLMTSDTTGFAANLTPKAAMDGAGSSVVIVDNGATIATPILERVFGVISTGAITTMMAIPPMIYQLDGSMIIKPGRSVMTYTNAALTAAAIFYFLWEEVDVA